MLFVICFWRCFNFELKYLSSQWRVRKVMICFGKVCYSSYIIILAFVIMTILKAVIPNWRNGLILFSLLFTKKFWHWVIFKLKYLCSQWSVRKVIICFGQCFCKKKASLITNWRNILLLFSILFTKNFWHWVIFKLKYLGSQLSDRKVIICNGKVCSSSFRISPYFFYFNNS